MYERCRQRYLVYYESYRYEILQGRVRSETASSDEILMQKKRHDSRKTSYWSISDCSVHERYRQRYPRVRVFNNFVINVGVEPSSRLPSLRHQMTSDWRVFECFDAKEATC